MTEQSRQPTTPDEQPLPRTEAEWRERLTSEQFEVLRNKGTERAFTGEYAFSKEDGVYRCAGCGAELFSSETKYESGTGWPSFWQPIDSDAVELHEDKSLFMRRTEVTCAHCGGHLGHVFNDGPRPTGERYCMNSVSLQLDPANEERTILTRAIDSGDGLQTGTRHRPRVRRRPREGLLHRTGGVQRRSRPHRERRPPVRAAHASRVGLLHLHRERGHRGCARLDRGPAAGGPGHRSRPRRTRGPWGRGQRRSRTSPGGRSCSSRTPTATPGTCRRSSRAAPSPR